MTEAQKKLLLMVASYQREEMEKSEPAGPDVEREIEELRIAIAAVEQEGQ